MPILEAQGYRQYRLEHFNPELYLNLSQFHMLKENQALTTAHSSQLGTFLVGVFSAREWKYKLASFQHRTPQVDPVHGF